MRSQGDWYPLIRTVCCSDSARESLRSELVSDTDSNCKRIDHIITEVIDERHCRRRLCFHREFGVVHEPVQRMCFGLAEEAAQMAVAWHKRNQKTESR